MYSFPFPFNIVASFLHRPRQGIPHSPTIREGVVDGGHSAGGVRAVSGSVLVYGSEVGSGGNHAGELPK